ncbi:M23 family metallopeptidase [Pedobacter endophyticus]|uniref:M23 family metallopeptidase n=1 Tax=Pedobacter endophyticus TaxID=2789740 RepID=A0A7U3SPN2_9SPHI|nr:M23 family metallopeptidase [Pedobacter endophyticus]QPH38678.1 M23 family metallopeptidase [Pedobacter endophyticus]
MKRLLNASGFIPLVFVFSVWVLTANAQLSMPLNSMRINSGFGKRIHPVTHRSDFHSGIDLRARNEPVYAFFAGRISEVGYNPFLGKFIRIEKDGLECIYGHLSILLVSKGEQVGSGEVVAVTGSTGRVAGEHLHFSLRQNGKYLNPVLFIRGYYQDSTNKENNMENTVTYSLRQKLELLVMMEEVALNEQEALLYGVDLADREDPEDE